ncbi:MAG: hypothetical protein II180_01770 [Proteobacteria bacterium]|nr:hypothetical protein [Pseudomonadota bacterium]
MKHTRQLNVAAFCAAAALCAGLTACGDESAPSVRVAQLNEACSAEKPCDAGLECSAEGVCVVKKAQLNEACSAVIACADGLECGADGKCVTSGSAEPEKAKLGEACGADKACDSGLECGAEGKCVEKTTDPGPGPVEDPCAKANCPDGQACFAGRCYDQECIVGEELKACDNGQMCAKGECVDDGCQDKTCGEGEICLKGLCEDALCYEKAIVCSDGATCVKGNCVDNECLSQTCDSGLVCAKGNCVYPACVGKEACGIGKSCNEAGDCVFNEDPALKAEADKKETDENGGSALISLSLNNPPSKDVTVECALAPENAANEASVSCESVRFDASNYADVQMIHVVGLPDNVIDEDQKYTLTITTVSEDAEFNGLSQSIEMVNKNVDTVGVKIEADNLQTSEAGGSAVFTAVLKAKPAADVTFVVSTSNAAYGVINGDPENKLTVTFTPENWDQPQEIKVVGVDDDENPNAEDHKYQVTFENTVSEDAAYNGLAIDPIDVLNLDNDIADAFLSLSEIVTEENAHDPVDIKVRLGLAPKSKVNVSVMLLENKDADDVTDEAVLLSEEEFSLDKDSYKEGKIISIKGVDDHIIDGDQDYVVRLRFSSNDSDYNKLGDKYIPAKSIDTNIAGLLMSASDTSVSEDMSTIDLSVALTSIPTADVVVAVSSSDTTECTVSQDSLTFTADDWDKPQVIKVRGEDDQIVDGDIVSQIKFKAASEDKNFDAHEDMFEITTLDNDVAMIVVADKSLSIAENSEDVIAFTVSLSAEPNAPVTVVMKSSDESEIKILGSTSLVFNEENWRTPQTVQLKVQDDNLPDGTQVAHIDFQSASKDKTFDGLSAISSHYYIFDNESASVTLSALKTIFRQGDAETEMSVVLSTMPLNDVTVTLSTTNNDLAKLATKELKFTTANWNQPQTVKVTSDINAAKAAKTVGTISAVATGAGIYNNVKSNDLAMTIYAFEGSKEFSYTGSVQTVSLLPGTYKLMVWGASGGANGANINGSNPGGAGGYSEGTVTLTKNTDLFVYVGGQGAVYEGGFNGGQPSNGYGHTSAGGGATDIRIGTDSLYARVIVAGGGGGSTGYCVDHPGACGGGLTACSAMNYNGITPTGGTLTGPGVGAQTGTFGSASTVDNHGGGGGGGWYGGGSGKGGSCDGPGAGGSGWVYTEENYTKWSETSEGQSGQWKLDSSYYLTSAKTVAGNLVFPAPGAGTETGHVGNGYARITLAE